MGDFILFAISFLHLFLSLGLLSSLYKVLYFIIPFIFFAILYYSLLLLYSYAYAQMHIKILSRTHSMFAHVHATYALVKINL